MVKNRSSKSITTRTLDLLSLHEISRVLGASLDLDKLFNVILDTMIKQTNAHSGSLMLLDDISRKLVIRASRGISKDIVKKTRINLGEGIAGMVAQQRKALIIDDETAFSIKKRKSHRKIKSSISIPLCATDRLIGVLNLNRIPGSKKFRKEDLEAIKIFATESAIAIYNARLYIEAEEKIQHLFRFNVLSCALNSVLEQDAVIEIIIDYIRDLFTFNILTILLIEKDDYFLISASAYHLNTKLVNHLKKHNALVISSIKKKKVSAKRIIFLNKTIKQMHIKHKVSFPKQLASIRSAPLISKGAILGMLSIYSIQKDGFTQKDQQTLSTIANQASIALENATLYKNLRKTYLSTIKALAQAIEEKDVYTRGHSELVSYYSVAIAQALPMSSKFIESIQIAGILHDIGKIGIPEKILSKPSSLSEKEYEVIKKHPLIGKRILDPVNFFWRETASSLSKKEGARNSRIQLGRKIPVKSKELLQSTINLLKTVDLSDDIKTMIYHHHERYGGGGYPDGIKGNTIPIGARILAVADTFEAMTADRPYRKAFPLKKAIDLLKKCAPSQLDPEIVDLLIKLIIKKWVIIK